MRCSSFKPGLLALGLAAAAAAGLAEPVKVAVFKTGFGAQAVLEALKKDAGMQPVLLQKITADALLQYDALYIGSTSLEQPEQIKSVKIFVNCGGGLILNHAACGRYRPETLFPAIARKVLDRRDDSILRVKDADHPLAAGLPAEFEHAFNDHLFLEPGPAGTAVLADREGADVAVAGTAGAGRVVFNGALPGYWYDPTDYKQAEKPPEGAELQWILNAVNWAAGAPRLTGLPAGELAARRRQAEADIQYAELAAHLPNTDWFGNEMLLGSYLALPPVTEIGGRFFITYDDMCWQRVRGDLTEPGLREFFLNRLRLDVQQLKWLGITDIIYWVDMSCERVWHETAVPDSEQMRPGLDALAELIKTATPAGINVWAAWHSCSRSKAFAEKYCARDDTGAFYLYGGNNYVEDLLNPATLNRNKLMLDEYADKYAPLGNFKGLFTFDELWFNYVDFHQDDLPAMDRFCRERFGEGLPDDFAAKLTQRTRWKASDPWRRRYILFKQQVMTDFFRELVAHAHQRGLQMGVTTIYLPGKWYFGMDNAALSRLGADYIIGAAKGYPASMQWTHIYNTWGHYTTANLLGGPGGLMFTFNHLWRLITYGNDPHYAREFARHVYAMRLFADSQPLARVAFLENHQALEMLAPDPIPPWNRLEVLCQTAQRRQHVRRIYSQAAELFQDYRVLVAEPYAVRGLPAEALAGLRSFIENGGVVVALDADWSSARADMAEEKNCTAEMAGIVYGAAAPPAAAAFEWQGQTIALAPETPRRLAQADTGAAVLAAFSDGTPAVTAKTIGKGKVVALHFDAGAELSKPMGNAALAAAFTACLDEYAQPPVSISGEGVELRSALRKGNWLAVALFPERPPAAAVLQVDVAALGIEKKAFRLLMLGKQMEISRPGDFWGNSGFWTPEDLKKGFTVSLPEDHRRFLPLPDKFDLSDFTGKRGQTAAAYVDKVTRDWWDSEKRGKRKRDYAHELVVIAPADEPAMP